MTFKGKYVDVINRWGTLERDIKKLCEDVTEVLETDGNISIEEAEELKAIRHICAGIRTIQFFVGMDIR